MSRRTWIVATLALAGCLEVPPEVPPIDSPHKATATVDVEGRTIRGGNLTLVIPPGAVVEGDRIRVTVDEIAGTPAGTVDEVYIVEPRDYPFAQPVELSYRYDEDALESVADATKLFLGEARFDGWEALPDQGHDLEARRVQARVESLGVFGLVDPLAGAPGIDAGTAGDDAGGSADAGSTGDAGSSGDASSGSDAASTGVGVQVMLTWDNAYDLDLHLLRTGGTAFSTTDDCHYATRAGLDWAPAGPANNPSLDLDDTDGFGPESISIAQAVSGSYSVGVHLYNRGTTTTAATFSVAVLVDGVELQRVSGTADTCDQFFTLLDLTVVGGHVATALRADAASFPGKSACF